MPHAIRQGDIPGALVPAAYHEFVKSGDPRTMLDVLQHNLLDIVTMIELLAAAFEMRPPDEEQGAAPGREVPPESA